MSEHAAPESNVRKERWTLAGSVASQRRFVYLVVALFTVTWLVSVAIWRLGRIEQRWAPAGRV